MDSEIMLVTAHAASADTMTVVRGQEGTSAVPHSIGSPVNHVLSAAGLGLLLAPVRKSLVDFRSPADTDWTNAFAAAATWSSANSTPVWVPESSTAYVTTAPITLGANAGFFGSVQPTYGPVSVSNASAVRISPGTGFPANRGLFEISSGGRSTSLRGLALIGNQVGTNVCGVLFPGSSGIPELGSALSDLDICDFTGDGITGGARVVFLERIMIHANNGWGINVKAAWYDSRISRIYCFYNRLGGINIDSTSALITVHQSRFERSGQIYGDPQNSGASPNWITNSPGIRGRGGNLVTFEQCETDANNGPGVLILTDSATPTYRPVGWLFTNCSFGRDGQGVASVSNPTGAGVKVAGFANVGGQNVPGCHFLECTVITGVSNDSGTTAPVNPERGLWLENTEFSAWRSGDVHGNTTDFYFGSAAPTNPLNTNYRPHFEIASRGVLTPAPPEAPPLVQTGMFRDNGSFFQRYSGSAWYPVAIDPFIGLTYSATVVTDCTLGRQFAITATGNVMLSAPVNPVDGMVVAWEITASGAARTVTLATGAGGFKFGSTITALTSTPAGTTDRIEAVYRSSANLWRITAYSKGF